jgi:hypothetical protein
MFEERLLERLDADEEVQRDGRSAVIRRAVAEYLRRKRQRTIAEQYQAAYGDGDGEGLGDEFAGWDSEGVWPED